MEGGLRFEFPREPAAEPAWLYVILPILAEPPMCGNKTKTYPNLCELCYLSHLQRNRRAQNEAQKLSGARVSKCLGLRPR